MGRTPRPRLKMIVKVFASCLFAVAAASSESSSSESGSREGFRGPGLYFSPIEVDLACTAGSPLGAKLASAFETCLGGEHALKPEEVGSATERRRRRPNKGRKCPTVEQIKAKMGEGMEGDWCVLSQLGWIDEMGNENNETSTADLMSLKPEVLAELDESAMATCAEERVAMIGKMMEKKHKRCAKKFSEEDKAELMEMRLKIQGYQHHPQKMLLDSCWTLENTANSILCSEIGLMGRLRHSSKEDRKNYFASRHIFYQIERDV